jgi:mannose-1-phosphate guanylyltransferase
MRALLLAAGLGTRLKPLTNYLPKCLIPIHGRPLIDYWFENLINKGINEILINTHYFAPMVTAYIRQSSWSKSICIVNEENLLGTGGTVLSNRDFFREEPFLVAHADNLTLFDVDEFLNSHASRPSGTEITMMLFKTEHPHSCGVVELDARGIVQAFYEKVDDPPGNLANAAVYILEPAVLNMMSKLGKQQIDFSTEVIPEFMGKIFTFRNEAYHRDIGTVSSWLEANFDFVSERNDFSNADAWQTIVGKTDARITKAINIFSQEFAGNMDKSK